MAMIIIDAAIGLVEDEVSNLLGPDPGPLENLVLQISHPDNIISGTAWSRMKDCIDADADRFLISLCSLLAFGNNNHSEALEVLELVLNFQPKQVWHGLSMKTQFFIKQIMLGCVSYTARDENFVTIKRLTKIIGELAYRQLGPNQMGPEPWPELYPFIITSLFSNLETLQMFALLAFKYATHIVITKFELEDMGELRRIFDRTALLMQFDIIEFRIAALESMITVWGLLSPEKTTIFQKHVMVIFQSFSFITEDDECMTSKWLMKMNHHIQTFAFLTEVEEVELVANSLVMIMENDTFGYDTKRKAVNLMLNVLRTTLQSSIEIMFEERYLSRMLSVILSLMTELEIEGNENTYHMFSFGRDTCGLLNSIFGASKSIFYFGDALDTFVAPTGWKSQPYWGDVIAASRKHTEWKKQPPIVIRTAITVIGQLSFRLSYKREHETRRVMDWVLSCLKASDNKKVLVAASETIKRLAPCIRNCNLKLMEKRKEILDQLSHYASSMEERKVKLCLEDAYNKVFEPQDVKEQMEE